ncbi:MAG: hypothetical protein ACK5TG_22325 [Planctomyces sp.]
MSRYGRGSGDWGGGWGPYVSVSEKKELGRRAAAKLAKKEGRDPCPVQAVGRELAKTFWGKKWCENLDRYSSIANRLPRGATYVRNGSVADLVIESGRVRAIVGGSEAYTVTIRIGTLSSKTWKAIQRDCASGIETLLELLQGRFSTQVMTRLTQERGGLFPEKSEISMSCSCPDAAGVCKHIAAVFYGVAVRLDQQPELLFRLRNVDHLELPGRAGAAAALDEALGVSSQGEFAEGDLGSIFGIELEMGGVGAVERMGAGAVKKGVKKAAKAGAGKAVGKVAERAVVKKAARKAAKTAGGKAAKKAVKKSVKKVSQDLAKKIGEKSGAGGSGKGRSGG